MSFPNILDEIETSRLQRYNLMVKLQKELSEKKELIQLQIEENTAALAEQKRALYGSTVLGFAKISEAYTIIRDWLVQLGCKQIKKSTKCAGKNFAECMKSAIESTTGIKVADITGMVSVGYEYAYTITFTDKVYKRKLYLTVPNIKNVDMSFPERAIEHLETVFGIMLSESTFGSTREQICTYPTTTTNMTEFVQYLDEYIKKHDDAK